MSSNYQLSDLDSFLPKLGASDPRTKLLIGAKLLEYLSDSSNSIVCSDIGYFVDGLIVWLQCSNFKVVQLDLDILMELINRMRVDFQPYLTTAIPNLVDKLGDSKEVIREKTLQLFRKLVDCDVITVQALFDKIADLCFAHKNSNVREQIMHLLVDMLNSYGASVLLVSKLVPQIVKLLSDPNASVRCTAFDTICDLYKHVGEKLRCDLQKKYSIPNNKLPALMKKFDEIKVTSSVNSMFASMTLNGDEPDRKEFLFENMTASAYRPPITPSSALSARKTTRKVTSAGAVTEETFNSSFEIVPSVQIFSGRDVEDCLKKYDGVIRNANEDWSKRVDCLKKIRSIMVAGGVDYDEFYLNLGPMLPAFQASLKDLRSQVVREACITVAYLSLILADKFDRLAEALLLSLISLLQNSAKVVSSSGLICIRFLLRHTHSPSLIPIIVAQLCSSKSKEIRRACCEFMHLIFRTWSSRVIERHLGLVQEAVKKGITDADAEARQVSRSAFAEFAQIFPEAADSVKNSLDFTYRKMLLSGGSNSSSNASLNHVTSTKAYRSNPSSLSAMSGSVLNRSSSAIDPRAAKRAKTRAQYAAKDRQKCGTMTLQWKNGCSPPTPEPRNSRSTVSRTSISQPSSRSASPSSKLSYLHYNECTTPRSRRSSADNDGNQWSLSDKRNRSTYGSRDNSLNRHTGSGFQSHLPVRKTTPPSKNDTTDSTFNCDRSRQLLSFKLDDHESLSVDRDSTSYDSGISQTSSSVDGGDIPRNYDFPDTQKEGNMLKALIEDLSEVDDDSKKVEKLTKIKTLIQESPSDVLVMHFKLILGKIIALIAESQPAVIREMALQLLQTIVKRKTVTFLLKQFSDLIIIRVIALCGDPAREVARAAEACAITLSTHLPPEAVIRVILPLINSETTSIKLVAIKMLNRLIDCSDESTTSVHIDQIMPVLLIAYDDPESAIRKGAVFCVVALHKQSEEMKILLEPYINRLQGGKLKLLQLYIRKAEQGSSMPTSPRNI